MAAAQRIAVQRRAVEIGMTISTKSPSKIAPIAWRGARPLQRRVGWRLATGIIYDSISSSSSQKRTVIGTSGASKLWLWKMSFTRKAWSDGA